MLPWHTQNFGRSITPRDLMRTLLTEIGKAFVLIIAATIATWALSPNAPPLYEVFRLVTPVP